MTTTFKPITSAIRALAMDAVQAANSGHPGAPMGMAEIAEVLWRRHLRHNPGNPKWPGRDRFVLSNGHGSMLLYALLHLTGYDVTIDDIKRFRQQHSRTPGHPEVGETPGVETTTGPLGQGFANAVGMALAERLLAAEFNRPGHAIVDHRTFVFLGDGCLMEGVSHETASLAGTWKLGKLVAVYDDNGISIDGHVEGWFTDDTPARFEAYGWRVIRGIDGHDSDAVDAALTTAIASDGRPTLLCCRTIIGHGAPNKEGTHDVHGAPLGAAEIAAARKAIGWEYPPFEIPAEIYAQWNAQGAGPAPRGRVAGAVRRLRCGLPRSRCRAHAPHRRRAARRLERDGRGDRRQDRGQGRDDRDEEGLAELHRGALARPARDAGRLGGSHRARTSPTGRARRRSGARAAATTSTTACASSAWPPS